MISSTGMDEEPEEQPGGGQVLGCVFTAGVVAFIIFFLFLFMRSCA